MLYYFFQTLLPYAFCGHNDKGYERSSEGCGIVSMPSSLESAPFVLPQLVFAPLFNHF